MSKPVFLLSRFTMLKLMEQVHQLETPLRRERLGHISHRDAKTARNVLWDL